MENTTTWVDTLRSTEPAWSENRNPRMLHLQTILQLLVARMPAQKDLGGAGEGGERDGEGKEGRCPGAAGKK